MAAMDTKALLLLGLVALVRFSGSDGACSFPTEYDGTWYHRASGKDSEIQIGASRGTWDTTRKCVDIFIHNKQIVDIGNNATILLKADDLNCYMCVDVIYRSVYILQFRKGGCLTHSDINLCEGIKKLPEVNEVATMFKQVSPTLDCIESIEGKYQFSYEIQTSGGGICNNTQNILNACQVPGSPNWDNKDFIMNFKKCPNLDNSYDKETSFKCMGRWNAHVGGNFYTYIALADDSEKTFQDKYKCLITLKDQHSEDNTIRWGMSRFGDCSQLKSLEDSPVRIVLKRIAPTTEFMNPLCTLPRNMSGLWFTQGIQFASNVWINESHIHYKTLTSQFNYEETWFSCQAQLGSRYLMTKVVVGRCEVNFVCFDIAPRHQGILRYRVGRPVNLPLLMTERQKNSAFLSRTFQETCSWQWLTLSRDNADWKYEILIQDPPSPVICPIRGRYYFKQNSNDPYQLYDTRIRGVTERPRNIIYCQQNVSEFKSCETDKTRMEIDAWYCETVDYRGKPLGEYEEPDHVLTCSGFWMEDMKSYLITYDEEDAISRFRCWVYERISWTQVSLSRAETARCPRDQTSRSYTIEGARLSLELSEQERLFDDCPPMFDAGIVPYAKPQTVYTLNDYGGSDRHLPHILALIAVTTVNVLHTCMAWYG